MYKLSKLRSLSILLILLNNLSHAQLVSRPFPQHVKYTKGIIKPSNVSQLQLDDSVHCFYDQWKERYLKNNAGENQYYIWVAGSAGNKRCVSEGQGYGMVIVALLAGYDIAAQRIYNGLYYYYKAHPGSRSPYLMAWAQSKTFADVDGTSAADGDLDIAYSLLLADAQWGSNGTVNYRQEALSILAAIMKEEINPETFSIMLSDAVVPESHDYFDMRSSDFMPAHLETFRIATGDVRWGKVIDNNYELFKFLQKKYSDSAGLLPDFIENINLAAVPAKPNYLESRYDGYYNYNACRVPWRIATDFIVNGDRRSKAIVSKINKWIRETTQDNPDNISAGYTLKGNDIKSRRFEAMSFIAPFSVAAMVDSKNQSWLNSLWTYIMNFDINQFDYYGNTIKMINMIILSGNYWAPIR